jgi:hypothetical protein
METNLVCRPEGDKMAAEAESDLLRSSARAGTTKGICGQKASVADT